MKAEVLAWAEGGDSGKVISKETLNHRGIVELVSGLDVMEHTGDAFLRAYEALGIDICNRVPVDNAPPPTPPGEVRQHPDKPYGYTYLGVYDTACRNEYQCSTPEEVWELDMASIRYGDLIVPVPHSCEPGDIQRRWSAIGEVGLYYPLYYTTLFMWGVEVLGWEVFLLAAAMEPDRFHDHFILPCAAKSRAIVDAICYASDSPFIFLHDDLAGATGPMFAPSWYDEYVFPHYPEIWEGARQRGKKIIFVADGNMTEFLERLVRAGVDGIMFENPATSLDAVIEHFGRQGRFMIGGIETAKLTTGTPAIVRKMVLDLAEKTKYCPGFAISSCGGLHGNIPLRNLEAYFEARAEIGATPRDWRTRCRG